MSYIDRLQPSIQLTSPEGNVFTANWKEGDRSKEKKLGIFDYPNFNGSDVQDLGTKGPTYPLTIYFPGDDNDLEGNRFFSACDERGPWEVIHPEKGTLTLQLTSVTEKINPLTSGGLKQFDTNWIEPIKATTEKSTAQLGSEVDAQATASNESSQTQYDENIALDQASEQIANEQAIKNSIIYHDDAFGDIVSQSDTIAAEVAATTTGIYDSLNQSAIDSITLAGQMQQLVQLPILATNDISARVEAYGNYVTAQFTQSPTTANPESKNTANVIEVNCSASLVAMAQSIISGELSTRSEAIDYIEAITDLFDTITDGLDDVQTAFDSEAIDKQYFSNSASYADLARLVGLTIQYLLRSSLDLRIEKRFIIDKQRTPTDLTVENYGTLGANDENLDYFISTNNLMDKDIRLLPAGREVVVYL